MADLNERIQVASAFVLQSPPGEINDVLNDVRSIVNDDGALENGLLPALREYNLAQFILVDVPDADHQTIVSDAARLKDTNDGEERFLDPRSKTSFIFDHLRLEASDPRPEEPDLTTESLRAALESAALSYLSAHYIDGVAAVFASQPPSHFTIQIVSNKYNPSNFWSGRWRSQYEIDFADSKTIVGKVLVNVHYYEQGNVGNSQTRLSKLTRTQVQLETSHHISIPIPPGVVGASHNAAASKILALIEVEETRLQTSLSASYHEMSEKAFKGLRRALPLTRQKIDWDKVTGYKLGAELTASKGAFVTAS